MHSHNSPTSTPRAAAGLELESSTADAHPTWIGPYRILSVLGEGGMGVVYLAEQTEPVRREVALKILKAGMDTKQVIARFEAERQALAVMEHPGIAKVYDAGATEAGRPFFAMERVDGVPITEYCDEQRLGVRERVRLFAQVCRAVQHAHQKGVIHRDLKPSNVLVTLADEAPLCKIIDFGIARAVEKTLEEQTRLTQADQSLGTPAYMSPEQVEAGHDIDTRSDIYSLGVLLYELLAGELPFEPQAYRGWAFYAQHLVREPPVPSARFAGLDAETQARIAEQRSAEPAALRRQLRGDLDWVTMRALEKDRERRYETANGFALDLERFLANEPVAASPPSRAYRARKFVRRHRAVVAFAAVLAVLLVGFAAAMGVQAERVARARDLAVVRQGQAEDLIGFMLGDLRDKLTPVGRLDILDDVGARAMAYFAAVPESELSDQELFRRAQALTQIGEVRFEQGNLAAATEAFQQALELSHGLAARDPQNPEWQLGLATSHYWLGFVRYQENEPDAALEHLLAQLRITERLVAQHPDSTRYRLDLSKAHGNVGSALEGKGELQAALVEYLASLAAKEELVRRDPENAEFQTAVAVSHNKVGFVQRKLGDLHGALESQRAELAIREALAARDANDAIALRFLALAHNFHSELLVALGEPEAALEHRLAAWRIGEDLAARDPTNVGWRRGLAISARFAGIGLAGDGQARVGIDALRASRDILRELVAADPMSEFSRTELARTETALAAVLRSEGRLEEALTAASRALEVLAPARERSLEEEVAWRAQAEAYLEAGWVLARMGRAAEAREMWTHALREIEPLAANSQSTDHLAVWATALLALGDTGQARAVVDTLLQRGYRNREFVALARER